jgi:hypothetical protein
MRLGQLARKLSVIPTEIVNFLATNNIRIDESTNTRIEHEQLILVVKHFAPARMEEFIAPAADETPTVTEEPVQQIEVVIPEVIEPEPVIAAVAIQQEIIATDEHNTISDNSIPDNTIPDAEQELQIEVIKAPKVELAGLKVLGKIELPQPKKKEVMPETETDSVPAEQTNIDPAPEAESKSFSNQRKEGRRKPHHKSDQTSDYRNKRPRKNPIALQREREAYEAELKREAEAKSEKERRTLYYQQRVKASVPTKPARLIDEPVMEMTGDLSKAPTTLLGKFWKWFRS